MLFVMLDVKPIIVNVKELDFDMGHLLKNMLSIRRVKVPTESETHPDDFPTATSSGNSFHRYIQWNLVKPTLVLVDHTFC